MMTKTQCILSSMLFAIFLLLTQSSQAADYTNTIGMKFKTIPAGSFYMGYCTLTYAERMTNRKRSILGMPAKKPDCPSGAALPPFTARGDNTAPQHKVHISRSFQIGIYEVTLGQYKIFIEGADRGDLLTDYFVKSNMHGDKAAVTHVSWNDAQSFVNWLNKKERGNHYRLPTEAEWEYVARAGTTTIYSWGNSESQADSYAWYRENAFNAGRQYAHTVGQKKPNPWGVYDMSGNVREWVYDWYDENFYRNSPSVDPKGPSSGTDRVLRGGGFFSKARNLGTGDRFPVAPHYSKPDVGFRLVRIP